MKEEKEECLKKQCEYKRKIRRKAKKFVVELMSDPENEEIEIEDSESGLSSNSKNEAEEDGEKSEDNESDEP